MSNNSEIRGFKLPIGEASGLGSRHCPQSGGPQLLAIGDEAFSVASATPVNDRFAVDLHPVTGLPDKLKTAKKGSQWEAIDGDGSGQIVILSEAGSLLLMLSPDFSFERSVSLEHQWSFDDDAGLESILLLRHGHVLAAKQRKPLVLIEFAPQGEPARGFKTSQIPDPDEAFELPAGCHTLHEVRSWKVGDQHLESINDFGRSSTGHLLVVSSRSEQVARLDDPGEGHKRIAVRETRDLPRDALKAKHARAEGLVVHPTLGAYIAVDTEEEDADNVFDVTVLVSGL